MLRRCLLGLTSRLLVVVLAAQAVLGVLALPVSAGAAAVPDGWAICSQHDGSAAPDGQQDPGRAPALHADCQSCCTLQPAHALPPPDATALAAPVPAGRPEPIALPQPAPGRPALRPHQARAPPLAA